MGSACCVAAKDKTSSKINESETLHRNALYSPSWSIRVGKSGHLEIEGPSGGSRHMSMEMKGDFSFERGNRSNVGGQSEKCGTPISQKSSVHEEMVQTGATPSYDLTSAISSADIHSTEGKSLIGSPEITASSCAPNLSFSIPSTSFSTPPATDPFPFQAFAVTAGSTPSRRARRSPGHQLLRQVSDSRILGLKSPNSNSVSEGRPSFVLSACSNDFAARSHGGSSDGWSMRMFSELVASSQRERWSFDSEVYGSNHGKICGSSSRFSSSPASTDPRPVCGACSKPLSERTSCISSNEISVVAVLVCGHVYHADCLETMTLEVNKYDPVCPVCVGGEKQHSKMPRRASLRGGEMEGKGGSSRISKSRVVNSFFEGDAFDYALKVCDRKEKAEPEPSGKNSFVKPFLRRHFSIGSKSKWGKSLSLTEKKGFWGRHHKD